MASILILLATGQGVQLANRLDAEGHIVKTWGQRHWKGKIGNYLKLVEQYDLVLCDGPGYGQAADELVKEYNRLVLCGGILSDRLAYDQNYLQDVLDIVYPELPLAEQHDQDCVKLAVVGYHGRSGFVPPSYYALRYERLMDGDKGPNNGGMGNVVWPANADDAVLGKTLMPLGELLKRVNYLGLIGLEVVLTKDKAYFVRFLPSFDFDSFQAWMELIRMTTFEYLYNLATRDSVSVLYEPNQCSIGIRLITFDDLPEPVTFPPEAAKHVWLEESRCIGCVTARGTDVREARRRVYRTINNAKLPPEVMYRGDIGQGADAQLHKLKEWQWVG